jgi:hypothetical protein
MSYINPPSDEVLEVIRKHFAKEYDVNPKYLDIDSIESVKNVKGDLEYHLDFSINWDGTYDGWDIRQYWGEITHNEVLQDMREYKLNEILKD